MLFRLKIRELFLIIFLLQVVFVLMIKKYYENWTNVSEDGKLKKVIVREEQWTMFIVDERNWIINNHVAQYSPRLIVDETTNRLVMETLALTDYEDQTAEFQIRNVKFIVKYGRKLFIMNIDDAIGNTTNFIFGKSVRNIWQFNTFLDGHDNETLAHLDQIHFALTDYKQYVRLMSYCNHTHDLVRFYSFHKPTIYYTNLVRKKAVAHCVHFVRHLDNNDGLRRMLNWLQIQKSIGIDKIKAYFYKVDKLSEMSIRIDKNSDFLQIIEFKLDYNILCAFQLNFIKLHGKSSLSEHLLKLCNQTFKVYFEEENWGLQTTMELFTTNDCFISYKYSYEFVSNYDFDELIFPHKYEFNNLSAFESHSSGMCSNKSSPLIKYNLYDYLVNLNKTLSVNLKEPISAFSFQHVLFLKNFTNDLYSLLSVNVSNKTLNYTFGSFERTFPVYYTNSEAHIKTLAKFKHLVLCLNKTLSNNAYLSPNWNRPFGFIFSHPGKTIFNTKYTISINQHYSFVSEPNTIFYMIPHNLGYYSHYRENTNYLIHYYFDEQSISMNDVILDLETYFHFVSLF